MLNIESINKILTFFVKGIKICKQKCFYRLEFLQSLFYSSLLVNFEVL